MPPRPIGTSGRRSFGVGPGGRHPRLRAERLESIPVGRIPGIRAGSL